VVYRIIFILIFTQTFLFAQVLDFSNPAQVCSVENVKIENTSGNGYNNFQWDFCEGDLFEPVQSFSSYQFGEIDQAAGIKIVTDGGSYYGFIIDRSANSLFRFDFGLSLNSKPVIHKINLPPGLTLSSPQGVNLIQVSNNWFGFIASTGSNKLFRLDFGTSLLNDPSAIEINFLTHLNAPVEIEIAKDGNDYFLLALNFGSNNVVSANLGSVITNHEPLSFQVTPITGSSNPYGLSIQKYEDGNWRGIVGSFSNNSFHSLDFTIGLNGPAVVNDITSNLPVIINPVKIALVNWGKENVLLAMAYEGRIHRVQFKRNAFFTAVESSDIINAPYGPTLPLSVFYDKGNWKAFTMPITSRTLNVLNFNKSCSQVNLPYYEGANPPIINFNSSSVSYITLRGESGGVAVSNSKELVVTSETAPSINFISEGVCLTASVNFISDSDQNIQQYQWSFGDSQTSSLSNPSNQYASAGDYMVQLNVQAENGCNNFTEKQIKIYNPPDALFDSPLGIICTNNQFTFVNNTVDNFDGNLSYEWLVNDVLKSTSRDLAYIFNTQGDQQIKLKASIPGCSDESTQTISNVQVGPVAAFSYSGKCEEEEIVFSNQSSGAISEYLWQFGNGNTSALENPMQVFTTFGQYPVTLSATGANGCVSSITKNVGIHSVPQTDFTIALPPFSCSNSLSQFTDLTPSMPDSNIASWAWTFGDSNNGTSVLKNPQYNYSLANDYSVKLTTITNFGCSNSIQKAITILPSPVADFTVGPACINQGTQFTDTSSGEIKSWLWLMQSATYNTRNPIHIFNSTGSHTVSLRVTDINNCVSQISKPLTVPVQPLIDFSVQSNCATKPAVLTEINAAGSDPAVAWNWEFGAQATGTGNPTQYVFNNTGTYAIKLNTTRQSGCTYSTTRNVSIVQPPKAIFTILLESGAAPFTVDLTNKSTQATNYLWKPGDSKQTNSTAYSPSFTYTELGDYIIELEASNEIGCKDQTQQLIHVVIPQINAAITDFNLGKNSGGTSYSPVVTIENKSNVALIDPEIFLDISGSSLISERISGIIKPNQTLTYKFNAELDSRTLKYACAEIKVNADNYEYDNRECVNVVDEFISLSPYPNPAQDVMTIEWINVLGQTMDVNIFDAAGKQVLNRSYTPTREGLNQVTLDVSQLYTGLYFISYSVEGKKENFKFSIVR
jgi:PKD repeat protein